MSLDATERRSTPFYERSQFVHNRQNAPGVRENFRHNLNKHVTDVFIPSFECDLSSLRGTMLFSFGLHFACIQDSIVAASDRHRERQIET